MCSYILSLSANSHFFEDSGLNSFLMDSCSKVIIDKAVHDDLSHYFSYVATLGILTNEASSNCNCSSVHFSYVYTPSLYSGTHQTFVKSMPCLACNTIYPWKPIGAVKVLFVKLGR